MSSIDKSPGIIKGSVNTILELTGGAVNFIIKPFVSKDIENKLDENRKAIGAIGLGVGTYVAIA